MDWRENCSLIDQQGHLLESGAMSDCVFRVGAQGQGQVIQAHKLMLYRASSVFETMFYGSLPETGEVRVIDIEPEIFKLMLKYIYTEVLPDNLSVEDLAYLSLAANKYLVCNLRQACIDKLISKITWQNVWNLLNLSDVLSSPTLYNSTMKMIADNAYEAFHRPAFLEVSRTTLVAILKRDHLNISSEIKVIDACLHWAKHQCKLLGVPPNDSLIRDILGTDIISNLRFLTLKHEEFAAGPGTQNWLTAEEKVSVFTRLSIPGSKLQLNPVQLCSKITHRNDIYDKKCGETQCKGKTNQSAQNQLRHLGFNLPRTENKFSYIRSGTNFQILVYFLEDVLITKITLYTQINNDTARSNDEYLENITFRVSKYNCSRTPHIYEYTLNGICKFNHKLIHQMKSHIRFDQNTTYILSVCLNKSGHYPLCDPLPSAGSVFPGGSVLPYREEGPYSPISSVGFMCL